MAAAIKEFFEKVGRALGLSRTKELSAFQKKKLLHEFHVFYDVNKDGCLEWKDLEMARESICKMSGWKQDSDKYGKVQDLFKDIWRNLQDCADQNFDGRITSEEWVAMWQKFQNAPTDKKEGDNVPPFLDKYIEYKFGLFDRTGDGEIDVDEFEYVLSCYGMPSKDCRLAFTMLSENKQRKIDYPYFRELAVEYYRSADPSALGNFINGKLEFE